MKKLEVLAPAGSIEAFKAAIMGGTDAIYLAGKMFGARAFANNFTNEELIYAINYAHLYGVKVYVTCNILIYEREIKTFLEYIEFLHKNHVDAIIMQDLGMIDLVHKTFPNLEIHASTQMHIHNLEGAKIIEKLGVKRVVVARETPLNIIKKIKEETSLEVEVFVHGALCASYSGMCLFARSIGPRSGNRGTCSGCCRLPYNIENQEGKIINQDKYPLSMKDLNTLNYFDKLIDIGIDSFKIEGRMKSPSYVYLTTKLYKETSNYYLKHNKIKVNLNDLEKLENVFNREYTKGFMLNASSKEVTNPKSPNHQGVRIGKVIKSSNKKITIKLEKATSIHDGLRIINNNFEYGLILNEFRKDEKLVHEGKANDLITLKVNKEIPLNSIVLRTLSYKIEEEIKNIIASKVRRVPITMSIDILKNQKITLKVNDLEEEIKVTSNCPDAALNKATTKDEIKSKLLKVQNTIYEVKDIQINLDDNLFVPISLINNLKREALELLNNKRLQRMEKEFIKSDYKINVLDYKEDKGYSLFTNNQDDIYDKYKVIYTENLDLVQNNIIRKLPKVMNTYQGIDKSKTYLVGELGGLSLDNIVTDYSLNVTNSYTVALLHSLGAKRVTLSLELTKKEIEDLITSYKERYKKNPNLELIVNTNMELMVLKLNFKDIYPEPKYLIDRFKNKYPLVFKNNLMYIYDYKKYKLDNINQYHELGINYLRDEFFNDIS